eukprot:TRINITY_DN11931_c0_g1_i1.p1 TRINITY_DN11931_c0_g1~~TRINITY_DN11931_c0_g1_i1.p1  ORF type:complete len:196 (-),score=92.39 TRINITY_DN11931_c0_g1_i1:48-635(-)
MSAGREDIDVRMMGTGRPYIIEVINPKKIKHTVEEYQAIERKINEAGEGILKSNLLQAVSKSDLARVKDGEEAHDKTYTAVVVFPRDITEEDIKIINETKNIKVFQRTPVRVLHRRSLATREKVIIGMNAQRIGSETRFLLVELQTGAGAYVKEFVHGDLGRTVPNLGSLLGCDGVDIIQLDVTQTHMEFPTASE